MREATGAVGGNCSLSNARTVIGKADGASEAVSATAAAAAAEAAQPASVILNAADIGILAVPGRAPDAGGHSDAAELVRLSQQLSHRLEQFARTREADAARADQPPQVAPLAPLEPGRARFEQLLVAKSATIEVLRGQLVALEGRQQAEADAYISELERLQTQMADLSSRLHWATIKPKGHRAVHHSRFAAVIHHSLSHTSLVTKTVDLTQKLYMNASIFAHNNYQPVFKAKADGVYALTDFLVLHDRNFINAAYTAILHRPPDLEGEAHYLSEVRSGESKGIILHQMMQADEARQFDTFIHGLDDHVRLTKICSLPIIGRFIEAVLFLAGIRAHLRDLRVLENHVVRIAEEAQILNEVNMTKLRSLLR